MAAPRRSTSSNHGSVRDSTGDIEIYEEELPHSQYPPNSSDNDDELSDEDSDEALGDAEFNENRPPPVNREIFDLDMKDIPIKSIEPAFKVSHNYDRSFSTTTAIHIDDHIGKPFDDEDTDEETSEDEETKEAKRALVHNYGDDGDSNTIGANSRQVSDTFSAMPDEIDYGSGGYDFKGSVDRSRTPQSAKRHARTGTAIWSSSPVKGRPSEQSQQHQPPQSNSSAARHSTPFRNPSSVRAMQMSSPSPPQAFSSSPKSARFRREVNSRHGTPSRRIGRFPSQQSTLSNSNREYPLVLLHCSISPTVLPYSSPTLQKVLPSILLENIAILREKIGPTVLERGILIPHPGEDYELLEERVLENLDLRVPRVSKSGHFDNEEEDSYKDKPETEQPCTICNGRLSKENSCFHKDDPVRRKWDMRVFAANGLMRAGAWSAAWREMEKVDIEIGVWLSEDLRRELEREKEAESVEELRQMSAMHEGPKDYQHRPSSPSLPLSLEQDEKPTQRASTPQPHTHDIRRRRGSVRGEQIDEYVGMRKTSTSSTNQQKVPHSRNTSTGASSAPISSASTHRSTSHRKRLPLSTLLWNYIQRTLSNRPDIVLQLLLFLAAVVYLSRLTTAPTGTSSFTDIEMPAIQESLQSRLASVRSGPSSVDEYGTAATTVTVTASAPSVSMFTSSPSEETSNQMTVVPTSLAESLLDEHIQLSTASSSSFTTTTTNTLASASPSPSPSSAGVAAQMKQEQGKSNSPKGDGVSSKQAKDTSSSQDAQKSSAAATAHAEL